RSLSDVGEDRMMDRKTGFQTGHVGDGASGRWRAEIAPDQLAEIHARHASWLENRGFPLS
ncbi:MAG: hypothetical protein AAF684_07140, partial [Pseudomonadota bacterium]